MSMLRRPITQLTLGEDDVKWMKEQFAKKQKEVKKEVIENLKDEPMEQSKESCELNVLVSTAANESQMRGTLMEGADESGETTGSFMISPILGVSASVATPVNGDSILPPAAPDVRMTRAQARQLSRNSSGAPSRHTRLTSFELATPSAVRFEALPETPEMTEVARAQESDSMNFDGNSPTSPSRAGPSLNTRSAARHL